ncbi:hypothetical protein, partial [Fulvimonas soli]|uniref:hypothetical protein n=1 Tax=Fulvimonas soli TaxID=155197 RepID=UPI001B86CD14
SGLMAWSVLEDGAIGERSAPSNGADLSVRRKVRLRGCRRLGLPVAAAIAAVGELEAVLQFDDLELVDQPTSPRFQ